MKLHVHGLRVNISILLNFFIDGPDSGINKETKIS